MRSCCLCDLFAFRFPFALILSSIIILLFVLLSPQIVYSLDITLAWNMAEIEELAGFKTFYREEGQEYNYDNPAWDGNTSTCTISINDFKERTPYYFVVRAYSTKGDESDDSNEVRYLSTANLPPIADAGPVLTIDEGVTGILDGSGSVDPDGIIVSYNWIQLTGTNAELVDSTLAQASFIAPDVGPGGELLTFRLTVTDDGGLQSTDTCKVNVSYVKDLPINNPPTAEANGSYSGIEGQAISFSSAGSEDVNGDSITYNWNFGDGTISANANPLHTYARNGTYNVTLTVSDGSLTDMDTTRAMVSDINPVVDFSAKSTTGSVPLTANFTATATSYDGITSYFWDFGDGGTDEAESPRHTYTSSGTYTVSLRVKESDGDTATETKANYIIVNNNRPAAEANGPYSGIEGQSISFNSTGSRDVNGDNITYHWNFGDGTTSTSANPSHTYVQNGTYNVYLTVSDGSLTDMDTASVTVSDTKPGIDFTATPTTGKASLTVNFTAAATSYDGITSYFWDFGDGGKDESESPRHTYTASGTYTVSLRVKESDGDTATETKADYVTVSISNKPPVAEAGNNQTVNMGSLVNIDGSKSEDPDGSIVSYHWKQISGPYAAISHPMSAHTTFTAPDVGPNGESIILQLTVTDNGDLQSTDTCTIDVTYVEELPTLIGLSISGESSLNENSISYYIATALFSDGNTRTVTDIATWSDNSPYADIDSTGKLSALEVTKDEIITITTIYHFNGITKTTEKPVTIIDIPESTPAPFKPAIVTPLDGQRDCEMTVHLTTLPFSDPSGNTHTQTQWQISKQETFSTLVLNITNNEHLTELTVPNLVLEPQTTYYVRARFYNSFPETSDWSDVVEFRTNYDINDLNANGIPDDQEIVSSTDLNEDGIDDYSQPETIKCVQTYDRADIIAISRDPNTVNSIDAMQAIDPSTISEETKRPRKILFELFAYRISLNKPGATIYQRVYFSGNIRMAKSFYKYDTVYGWEDYTQYVTFDFKTNSIIIELTDGGKGDSDGTVNGIIIDPGGLIEDDSAEIFDNGSPKGGCFIESIFSGR